MIIHYKYLISERMEDAPFCGALLCANDCIFNCKECFNQELKNEKTLESTPENIINEILSNPINEGVIFGGLEWSLQQNELLELVNISLQNNLKVMIYTGLEYEEFFKKVNLNNVLFYGCPDVYIKTGRYDLNQTVNDNIQYGIKLASKNQKIIKLRKDKYD